jgi:hypothetical protein
LPSNASASSLRCKLFPNRRHVRRKRRGRPPYARARLELAFVRQLGLCARCRLRVGPEAEWRVGRFRIPAGGRGRELVQLWQGCPREPLSDPGCLAVDEVESVSESTSSQASTGEREQPVDICWDYIAVD